MNLPGSGCYGSKSRLFLAQGKEDMGYEMRDVRVDDLPAISCRLLSVIGNIEC
jgi:hypothetical protein